MIKKLRIKFVCFTMTIVTLMLCAIFATVCYFTSRNLEQESLQMMRAIAEDPFSLGRPGESAQVQLPYFALQIGPFGDLIAVGGGYFDLSDTEFLNEVINAAISDGGESGVLRQYRLRYLWSRSYGTGCLVFADMSSELSTLRNLLETCAVIGAGSILLFLFLSLLMARWATKPVERAWEQQRQFVADASHELKTPLTVILTNAELLQVPGRTEEEREKFAAAVLAMAKQMRGLVESLLELARLDSPTVKRVRQELDLSELVSDAVLPFEPLYFEQGLELKTDIEPGINISGDPAQLRQSVEILLDNARKYSSPDSQIRLSLRRQGNSRCLLTVADQGDELSPQELKDIFKRFYRSDKARAMDRSYGLGLPIAESIVKNHGGRIWAESKSGTNSFFIELPVNNS